MNSSEQYPQKKCIIRGNSPHAAHLC